tara:strand:+ start:846 stop:1262 length:417 start_codon:yes stop_codon:yes gene_type:complete
MNLIDYIRNEIYFRVKPSVIQGVGHHAIKDIPSNIDILIEFWSSDESDGLFKLKKSELVGIHPNVRRLLSDYWQSCEEYQEIYIPKNFKYNQLYYFNHSDNPNVKFYLREDDTWGVLTIRDIKENEELTMDYKVRPRL